MRKVILVLLLCSIGSITEAQVRIACGHSQSYTDHSSNVWAADTDFTNGTVYDTTNTITGTSDSPLFADLRFGTFTYTIPVANGSYNISLGFAETYWTAAGQRVFGMQINGTTVLTNFDVVAKVGANTADVETFPVTVTNGQIVIQSLTVTNLPILNNIDIELAAFVWVMPGLGTATFPMNIPPACGPSDGTCSIQIKVCDTSVTPPVCMTSSQGTITLLKNITLPTPQQQNIPLVTVTP